MRAEGIDGSASNGSFVAQVGDRGDVCPFDLIKVMFGASQATAKLIFGYSSDWDVLAEPTTQLDAEG